MKNKDTKAYKLSKDEQEIIIRWDAANHIATIHADIPSVMRKLDKLVEEFPEHYICVRVDPLFTSKTYKVNCRHIRFARPMTEKTREVKRQNFILRRKTAQGWEGI